MLTRRAMLEFALVGSAGIVLRPAVTEAGTAAFEHRPVLEVPALAEDPTAVPVKISVDHPMEREHFVELVEVLLEADPVAHKGTYRFTPANGRARISFPMRSGAGGLLEAVVTCNRHGRFVGTQAVRVGGDGCASGSEGWRGRPGNPRVRVMGTPKLGEVVEVAVKVDHESDTGLRLKDGRYTRVRREFFVREMQIFLGGQRISDFQLTSALSSNAIVRFPVRVTGASSLRVVVVNSEGRRWEATEPIRLGPSSTAPATEESTQSWNT